MTECMTSPSVRYIMELLHTLMFKLFKRVM